MARVHPGAAHAMEDGALGVVPSEVDRQLLRVVPDRQPPLPEWLDHLAAYRPVPMSVRSSSSARCALTVVWVSSCTRMAKASAVPRLG